MGCPQDICPCGNGGGKPELGGGVHPVEFDEDIVDQLGLEEALGLVQRVDLGVETVTLVSDLFHCGVVEVVHAEAGAQTCLEVGGTAGAKVFDGVVNLVIIELTNRLCQGLLH